LSHALFSWLVNKFYKCLCHIFNIIIRFHGHTYLKPIIDKYVQFKSLTNTNIHAKRFLVSFFQPILLTFLNFYQNIQYQ
jgi:hypothetical protein